MQRAGEAETIALELRTPVSEIPPQTQHDHVAEDTALQGLKPVDGGRDAWTVLIAGFIFEALFWGTSARCSDNKLFILASTSCLHSITNITGFPMCFGVFQNYYTQLPEFQSQKSQIPLIGTLAQGLYYLGAPFAAAVTKAFPKHQRHQIWAGWPLCILGLLCASFTSTVDGLIATQGFLYGLGFVTLSYPIVSMVNEWWVVRKGMAFGLISAASGLTGAFMPFLIESLLAKYGHQRTLQASAVAMAVLTFPLLFLLKGRLPASEHSRLARINWSFGAKPLFWMYAVATLIQGIGFFFPPIFLPSYATGLNISATNGALLLSLMSIAQVLGQFAFGYLSDKNLSVNVLAGVCCVAGAVSSLTLWGLGKSTVVLIMFSLIYGFFGFGFGTMRVAMGRAVSDDPSTVFATFAIFVFLQGVGNILVGPISAALLSGPTMIERFATGRYKGLVILTGTSSAAAALVVCLWDVGKSLRNVHVRQR